MSTKIGFIGVGIMGKPMAAHLAAAGNEVLTFSRSNAAVDGCTSAKSIAELTSKSDVIILMLPDTPDVEKVLFDDTAAVRRAIGEEFPDGCDVWQAERFVGRFHRAAGPHPTVPGEPAVPAEA